MTPQPSQKGCCPACWYIPTPTDHKNGIYNGYCFNPQCECHQEAPKEKRYALTETGKKLQAAYENPMEHKEPWEAIVAKKFTTNRNAHIGAPENEYIHIISKGAYKTMMELFASSRDAALAEAMKEVKNANTMLVSSFEQPYTGTENSAFNDGLRMGVHALDRIAAALSALRD